MHRSALFHLCRAWVLTLVLTMPRVTEAQHTPRGAPAHIPSLAEARVGISALPPSRASVPATVSLDSVAGPEAASTQRSPVIAGVASLLFPGAGSLYASHPRHGLIHMGVHVVAGTLALVGTASCAMGWGGTTDCEEGGLEVVAVAWLVNWGWAVVSGVNDAKAYNVKHGAK